MSILARTTAAALAAAPALLTKSPVLVGLDGFVDTILHVVSQRESAQRFTRLARMSDFAEKIRAAAGQSANFELVPRMVKLGGNGPIMAHALCRFGAPLTYIGSLGAPRLHPVFTAFAESARVISIAEPAATDALEFDDGKLMCGQNESLKNVNWSNLTSHVPEEKLRAIFQQSALIALVNWTMLPHLSAIWKKLAARIAPRLTGAKRWLFFDLADPAKRSRSDLADALRQITRFQKYFRVILGLNLPESRQVGEVLGLPAPDETYGTVTQHAAQLRAALHIETVVIHPTHFAAAADAAGATHVVGPFTAQPKITTGAGDHFNAGFCLGRLLALDLASSLQLGVATSGHYVRHAQSPTLPDLKKLLRTL